MANIANVAAQIHANMCNDSGFGYSWGERYGTWNDPVTWNIEGQNYTIARGDYDCSSSVCTAWQTALKGTSYEGALDGATYTGNMRSVFVNSGLFDVWDTNSTSAVRGDVYLNDNKHTAMCQDGGNDGVYGYDALSEFCINEFGEVYGGQRGDQTGGESHITGYYNYPWSCSLHYNGKADTTKRQDDNRRHNVIMWHSHGKKNQRWQLEKKAEGLYAIRNKADGYYLDVSGKEDKDGAEVILWSEYNGGKNQLWKLDPVEGKKGCYFIVSAMNGARVLDVVSESQDEGATLCIYKRKTKNTANQEWYFLKNNDNTKTIINNGKGPKMALDASGQA